MRRPEDVTLTIGGGTVTENQPIFYYAPAKGWDKGTFRGFTKTKPAAPLPHHSGTHSGTKDPPNNSDGRPIVVRNAQGETFELAVRDVYLPLAETFTNAPPADLLALQELHHSVLVHALRERHAKDLCYTFLGSLLVYLNPFSYTIPHYSLSKIDDYLDRAPNPHVHDDSIGHELPPHVWSVAHRVFFEMRNSRKNSSIIISGESGSGKTEACKVALHYLCCLSADLVGADRPPHPQQQQLGGGDGGATHSHKTNPTVNNETAAGNIKRLIEKVNASNPIMEAFGNAKTARNDNSSRFGKLLEVQFSSSGEIGAMRISPFLLEKSRCVTSAQDERVYHSFYQLVAGASDAAKTELKIKTVRDFPMLSRGGSVQVQGVNDAKEFEITQNAFIQMGFSKDERDFVWRIVAAVLHLSTITFVGQTAPQPSTPSSTQNNMAGPGSPRGGAGGIASSARAMFEQASQQNNNNNNNNKPGSNNNNSNENKSAPIKSSLSTLKTDKEDPQANLPAQLSTASVSVAEFIAEKLLKVDVAEFKRLLTASVSVLKNEEVVKILTRAKAAEQRDSLCKYLYSSLFYWIIEKINVATNDHNSDFVSANSISILDIFGFEDFAAGNSLEQLCINLANEALQRHYCKHVFERDAEEIAMEGVSAETVKFVDNEPCVQLIMGPDSSLFTLLEDASLLDLDRGNTDQNLKYLEKITQKHKPDFGTSAKQAKSKSVTDRDMTELIKPSDFFGRSQRDPDGFVVKHFASDVRYAVDGFVEKNSDTRKEAMRNLLGCSDDGMMQELLNLGEGGNNNNNNEPGSPISSKATPTSPRTAGGGGGVAGSRVRRPVGIVGQFKRSLQELLSTLDNTSPNWIRCIRPHPKKAPKLFDSKSVLEQLMATGVLETITQRQRNFPFRLEIQNFVHRFGVVCAGNSSFKRMARSSLHEKCTAILTAASLGTRGGAQVGKTKVFLRTENLNKLERVRQDRVTIQAAVAQRFAAAFAARKMRRELEVEAASKRIKRWYKRFRLVKKVVKDYYEELIRKKKERDEAARQDLIVLEGKERALAQNMEKSDRAPYANKHREQLTPLLKAATAHLVKVEPSFREKISKLEYSERSVLVKNEQIEKKLAVERQIAREEAEERAFDDAINSLAGEVNSLRKEVRDEEKTERAELEKFWRPIHADILRLANRVRNLNEQREDRIRKLKDEMEKEKQRIKEAEERRIASEARLWSSLGGPKHMQKDIEKLVSLGLSDIEVERTMKKFFASGIPSQMLLSSNNNNTHLHGMPEASSRNQQSLKDVYLERIRNSSSSTTSSSSSLHRPGSSRESSSTSSSSENYRLHAPVGNAVTLDGYSSKLKAEYENAVRSGKVSVMPSEAKYEAARQVISHNSASTTQFSSRNDDFSRSALDSANISTKARDYAKYAKALKEKQQQEQHQQHINQNQQQQVQFLDPHMLMMMNSNPSSVTNNNSRKYLDDDDDDDNRNNVPGFVWKKV